MPPIERTKHARLWMLWTQHESGIGAVPGATKLENGSRLSFDQATYLRQPGTTTSDSSLESFDMQLERSPCCVMLRFTLCAAFAARNAFSCFEK